MPLSAPTQGSTPDIVGLASPGRISKNPKACEECRRRKQKCDGRAPCSLCTKRSSHCSYRSYIRHRATRASSTNLHGSTTPGSSSTGQDPPRDIPTGTGTDDSSSKGLPRSMPPRLNIFNNIRATQDTPRGKTELFYGASSPFSLLPHLDAHVPMQGSPAVYLDSGAEAVQNGNRSIRSYNYQNIVFDHLPNPTPHVDRLESISYASAKIALRNFLVTACPRLPFLDSEALCVNFERMYFSDDSIALPAVEKALVVTALGLGALPLSDLMYRKLFISQARAEAVAILYDINLKTVQATLMMALFEFQAGSPNICYLHLGSAIRKAFAAGVHRTDTHEAKQTMWALYCNESLVCFELGKQPGLTEKHIALPKPEDASHSAYFIRLCAIARSAYRIYNLDDTVVADLTAARSVHQQLCEYSVLLKKNTRLEIGGQIYALAGEELSWHIATSYIYYVTKLLAFRPFLLLCLELKRRGVNDILKERNGGVEMVEIYEAAGLSVEAARAIVDFCDSLFSLDIGIEGLYNHAFYLESACFVLGLAAVHGSSHFPSDCLEKVHIGLRLLRRLGTREPVRSSSAAIEQMVSRICALSARSEPDATHASGNDQQSSSTVNLLLSSDQPLPFAATQAANPEREALAPVEWNDDILLDDLWSMMDWNVGFPSMDLPSSVTTPANT